MGKTGLSSVGKSNLIKFGGYTKEVLLDGVNYVVESKVKGEDITVGGLFEAMAWSGGTNAASTLVNVGTKKAVKKITSNEKAGEYAAGSTSGLVEIGSSALQYVTTPEDERCAQEMVFYITIDKAVGATSSRSAKKVSYGDESTELIADVTFDMAGRSLGMGLKGLYQEYAPEDWKSNSSTDTVETFEESETSKTSKPEEPMSGN